MIRSVRMAGADADVLQLAARYIGTLAAVERAHALDDHDAVQAILGGVDPVDLSFVRAHLNELWALFNRSPVRIGAEPTADTGAYRDPTASASPHVAAQHGAASAPITPESRRV